MPWWSKRDDRDFRDEIETHLEMEAQRQMRQRGLGQDAAREAARRAFGNVTRHQERFYESQRWMWAERLTQHMRYALRALRQRPAFSAAAVLTLAVGIGFCTAIFTVYNAFVLRELPVRDGNRLVNVYQQLAGQYNRGVHGMHSMVSYPEFLNYQATIESLRGRGGALAGAAVYAPVELSFDRSPKGSALGEYVSCSYFQAVGARLALGRGFVAEECARPGTPAVAVVSYDTWMRDLGGDSAVIGKVVRVNQVPFTVIGVAEQGFGGLTFLASNLWLPVTMELAATHGRDSLLVRDWSWMFMAARLAPGGTIEAARSQLTVAARRRDALSPGRRTSVIVAKGALLNFPEVRQQGRLAAGFIAVLGALVVAMVCANIMNLLLARGLSRRREVGIRLALGASRSRLIEQLLLESLVLGVLGGAVGLAFAYALPRIAVPLVPIPGLQLNLQPDTRVLWFTVAVSLLTTLAFGLMPALQATGVDLVSAFKGGMTAGARQMRPSRVRAVIVGVQVFGSALLLIIAALFVRGAMRGATVDPGYVTENVVTFGLNLAQLGYAPERRRVIYDGLRSRIAATPGVEGVAYAAPLPLLGRRSETVELSPSAGAVGTRIEDVNMMNASASYFGTVRIPIVAGRAYLETDGQAENALAPMVISQSFASSLWPAQPTAALNQRLRLGTRDFVVVGIAGNTRAVTLAAETQALMYLPAVPARQDYLNFVVRTSNAAGMAELERTVPRWARDVDPALVVSAQRMSERVDLELRAPRIASVVSGSMGVLAMLLAVVGIYGVVSYAVTQRGRDIAVRLALGATQRGVVRLMMRQGLIPVIVGAATGAVVAAALARVIRGLLFGMSALDPVSYLGMMALLLAAAFAATWIPARRAARVNPAVALREE